MRMPGRDRVTESAEPGHADMDTAETCVAVVRAASSTANPSPPMVATSWASGSTSKRTAAWVISAALIASSSVMPSSDASSWASA